jgi:hypothetical protein
VREYTLSTTRYTTARMPSRCHRYGE